jgi:integrase
MALTGIVAGLRVGEILGLRWQDVDFLNRSIRIQQAAYRGSIGSPKTKGSKRTLPLPESLSVALRRHYDASTQRDGLVFPTRTGMPFSDSNLLARHLKPAGKQIGAPWLGWHTLRRTHATLLSQAGASPKDAQAQLGHAHMSTTMDIYTQPTPTHQRAAVERMSQLVTNGDELAALQGEPQIETLCIQ